jgi:type I restriction enzyme S subunit
MSDAWPETKIGECCDILDSLRVPLNAEERDDIQGEIPYYGANGLQGYIDEFIFDEPLILLAEDGGYFDEYEARPIAYRISGKSWVNNHAHVLRARAGSLFSQDFIFYCLQHKNITPFIKGGTRAKLNQSELREIIIPRPPEAVQRRIAEILSTLDETIEQTEALIAKYQQIKAGLMHDLFTRGVTPDGKLRPTRAEAPQLYKQSPLGWIPKEWEPNELETAALGGAPICYGIVQPGEDIDGGVRVVAIYNLNTNYATVHRSSPSIEAPYARSRIQPGDVLLSIKGSIGRVDVTPPGFAGNISRDIARIRPRRGVGSVYLRYLLECDRMQQALNSIAVGTTRQELSIGRLKHVFLPVAEAYEQEYTSARLRSVDCFLLSENEKREKLRQQKHGLMHDLLTGRVRVKVNA